MSVIYLSSCFFLFALHLDWYLNKRVDKKSNSVFIFLKLFHFSLWLKLSIFLVGSIFSLNSQQEQKKGNREKNKCRQTVLQRCTLFTLFIAGEGTAVTILRKNCHPFPPFPFIKTSFQIKIFVYSTYSFLLQLLSLPTDCLFNK